MSAAAKQETMEALNQIAHVATWVIQNVARVDGADRKAYRDDFTTSSARAMRDPLYLAHAMQENVAGVLATGERPTWDTVWSALCAGYLYGRHLGSEDEWHVERSTRGMAPDYWRMHKIRYANPTGPPPRIPHQKLCQMVQAELDAGAKNVTNARRAVTRKTGFSTRHVVEHSKGVKKLVK
jgi:hypothetical protein